MDWSSAHAKLHILLRKRNLLPKNSRILMAVSGGQDSLCLTQLLIEIGVHWQWSIGIVHCDHRWRADSEKNAEHVLQLAQQWRVESWLCVATRELNSEAAARHWRYEQFGDVARREGFTHVVTGHTQSDRAETVLYNLLRGTGMDGLGTLQWSRQLDQHTPPITLVRPLLNMSRSETATFCQQQQLPIWEDSSNQDLSYRRNRVRQELIPYLQEHFNPQVVRSIAQTAELTAADTALLNQQAQTLYNQTIHYNQQTQTWEIQIQPLSCAPLALQRRVIRQLLQKAIAKPPQFSQVEKLIDLLDASNGSQSDPYPGGWLARVEKPLILLGQFHTSIS